MQLILDVGVPNITLRMLPAGTVIPGLPPPLQLLEGSRAGVGVRSAAAGSASVPAAVLEAAWDAAWPCAEVLDVVAWELLTPECERTFEACAVLVRASSVNTGWGSSQVMVGAGEKEKVSSHIVTAADTPETEDASAQALGAEGDGGDDVAMEAAVQLSLCELRLFGLPSQQA